MSLFDYDRRWLEWINHHRIKGWDPFFIFVTNTASLTAVLIILIALLYSYLKKNGALKIKGWQMLLALGINSVIVTIMKRIVNRERPFISDKLIEKLSTGGSPSFPSGHTADAFVVAVSVSLLFRKQKWFLVSVWLWAVLVGYSRLALGVHYPSDVLGSVIISSMIALIINRIFIRQKLKRNAVA